MENLKTLEEDVKKLLINIPQTRNNDMILYYEYCVSNWVKDVDMYKVFSDKEFREKKGISVFESVSRARRKIQAEYEELRPTQEIQRLKL